MTKLKQSERSAFRTVCTVDFIIAEVVAFLVPVVALVVAIGSISNWFLDEGSFSEYVNTKVHGLTPPEFLLTMVGVMIALVPAAMIKEWMPGRTANLVASAIFDEFPRVFYVFGGGLAAVLSGTAVFMVRNPAMQPHQPTHFFVAAATMGSFFFAYGFGLKLVMLWRREVLSRREKSQPVRIVDSVVATE